MPVNSYLYMYFSIQDGNATATVNKLVEPTDSNIRMFADDTTLTASGKSIQQIESKINCDLINIKEWLLANKLSLKPRLHYAQFLVRHG